MKGDGKMYFNKNTIIYKALFKKKNVHAHWDLRNEGIKIIRKPQDEVKNIL